RAIEFYRDGLGFQLVEDLPFGEMRWVTLRAPDDTTVAITLKLARTDEERALVGRQGAAQPLFGIPAADCLAEYRRMKKAGVTIGGEPKVQTYGTGVTLEDLYGNKIYLNEEPE